MYLGGNGLLRLRIQTSEVNYFLLLLELVKELNYAVTRVGKEPMWRVPSVAEGKVIMSRVVD